MHRSYPCPSHIPQFEPYQASDSARHHGEDLRGAARQQEKRQRGESYCVAWPKKASPLVVGFQGGGFISATAPGGDLVRTLAFLILPVTRCLRSVAVAIVPSRLIMIIGEIVRIPTTHVTSRTPHYLLLSSTSRQRCVYTQNHQQQ